MLNSCLYFSILIHYYFGDRVVRYGRENEDHEDGSEATQACPIVVARLPKSQLYGQTKKVTGKQQLSCLFHFIYYKLDTILLI